MGGILEEAGLTFENVVKTTVLLADMGDFAAVNEIYGMPFHGFPAPSSTTCLWRPCVCLHRRTTASPSVRLSQRFETVLTSPAVAVLW